MLLVWVTWYLYQNHRPGERESGQASSQDLGALLPNADTSLSAKPRSLKLLVLAYLSDSVYHCQ